MLGLENLANIHAYCNYNLNKFFSFQGNFELNVNSLLGRRSRNSGVKFGFGLTWNSHSQEDMLAQDAEDFSNFSYDDYLSK